MNNISLTRPFMDTLAEVESDKLRERILDLIKLLPYMPVLGSVKVSKSLREKHGSDIRKITVPPFSIIYAMTDEDDFQILALVHQRMAW